jgi:gliding motility-associated-like protein
MNTFQLSDYNGFQVSCYGFSDGFISLYPAGGVSPFSYTWDNGTGNQSSSTGLSEGIYSVLVTDDNGCDLQNLYTLNAPDQLNAQLQSFPDTCYRSLGHAIALASGGVSPFIYNWNNEVGMNHFYGLLGGSNILSLYDLNNCSREFVFSVGNLDGPIANMQIISDDDCSFKSVEFRDKSFNKPVSWQWNIDGIGTSENQSDEFFFPEPGQFTVNLAVKNEFDCPDDTTVVFTLLNEDMRIFTPNSFTPNEDNLNSFFKPTISGSVGYELNVFNRWGEVVYSGNQSDRGWAGDDKGNGITCQFDLYYYTITAKGYCKEETLNGFVQLIK